MCKICTYLFLGFFAALMVGCIDTAPKTENLTDTVQDMPIPKPSVITVSGKLIDTKCYGMDNANLEDEHAVLQHEEKIQIPSCATACANMGIPVGLLKDGKQGSKVYVLITPSNQLANYMAKETRVTGSPTFEGGLIPEKIEVMNETGEWEEVQLATMM